jgi:WD40 repeat protein
MKLARIGLGAWIAGALLTLALILAGTIAAQSGPSIIWSQPVLYERSVAFSGDGQLLISGGGSAGVRVYRAADGTLLRTLTVSWSNRALAVAISPDSQYVADGGDGYNGNFNVWRTADGSLVKGRISAHNNGTSAVAFSPDGQFIATAGRDGTIKLWQLPGVDLVRTLNFGSGYRPRVVSLAYSSDGQFLADATQGGVDLWRIADGTLVRSFASGTNFTDVAYSQDGQIIAGAAHAIDVQGQCADCSVKVWRVSDGALLKTLAVNSSGGQPFSPWSLAISPDGQTIAEGGDGYVNPGYVAGLRFWNVSTGTLVASYDFEPESNGVLALAYAPDGNSYAYATYHALVVAHSPYDSLCSCELSQTSTFVPAGGGAGSVNMTTGSNCNWTAQSNANWITLTSAASGSGNSTITFEVRENFTGSARTGTLAIGNQSFLVVQDGGASPDCTTSVSSLSGTYPGSGGTGNLTVTTEERCAWNASSNVNWITFTSPSAGVGNATLSYTVASNPQSSGRKGTITINGQTVTVKQKGN